MLSTAARRPLPRGRRMKVRHPPGRAGRPWLAHRLQVARRGAELLHEKQPRCSARPTGWGRSPRARRDWEQRAREAELWLARAAMLGGERQLDFAAEPGGSAAYRCGGGRSSGSSCPSEAAVEPHRSGADATAAAMLRLLSAAAAPPPRTGGGGAGRGRPRPRCSASTRRCTRRRCGATRSSATGSRPTRRHCTHWS